VLARSARKEIEAARNETNSEEIARKLYMGHEALTQTQTLMYEKLQEVDKEKKD